MIYFVQESGWFRNKIKIGYTGNLDRRLTGLQNASPSGLNLLLALPGMEESEKLYHYKFREYRLHGEWFRYGYSLRLFIWMHYFRPAILGVSYDPIIINELEEYTHGILLTEEEQDIVTQYKTVSEKDWSWRKATQACFGQQGAFYNRKLKAILLKAGISPYTEEIK